MKIINILCDFLKNVETDKLFLTVLPAFLAFVLASRVFTFNLLLCALAILASVFLHIAAKVFDDFNDWVLGRTKNCFEAENLGVRGLYKKCIYYYNGNIKPRQYFYIGVFLLVMSVIIYSYICYMHKGINILVIIITAIIIAFINYNKKFDKILSKLGTEFLVALLCGPLNMYFVFYAATKCMTKELILFSVIVFFFIWNICYIASVLNMKLDIIAEKLTLPINLNKNSVIIYFCIFLTLFPYCLVYSFVATEILPKIYYLTLLLIPHSVWLIYLVILYIKEPHKLIKCHFLMGPNKYRIQDEQNNESWYYVRYNLARNIFCSFIFITIIILITTFNY